MKTLLDMWLGNKVLTDFELQLLYKQLEQAVSVLGPLGGHIKMVYDDLNVTKKNVDSAIRARKEEK